MPEIDKRPVSLGAVVGLLLAALVPLALPARSSAATALW